MKLLSIDDAVKILESGGVVAVPTETVYGLAAIADNKAGIEKIFRIKNRPADNPLICHFHSFFQAKKYLMPYPEYVNVLVEALSPGPVSFLLKLIPNSPLSISTAGREDIIIRIPANSLFLELLRKVKKPLAAPSANTSGRYSATNAAMVDADMGDKIDGIIDGGDCLTGIESTIIDCRDESMVYILRPGVIGIGEIRAVLGERYNFVEVKESKSAITTPGSKYKHYAPATPLILIQDFTEVDRTKKFVVITTDEKIVEADMHFKGNTISLGAIRNPETVARNLYHKMFEMDAVQAEIAYMLVPEIKNTTWRSAIMNRINKMVS